MLPLALRRKLALENLNFGCSDHSMILFVVAAGKRVVCLIVGVVGRRGLVVSPHKYQPKISPLQTEIYTCDGQKLS